MSVAEEKDVGPSPPPSPIDDVIAQEQHASAVSSQLSTVPPVDVIPDGGYGWVCTICCAMLNGHTWGMNSVCAPFRPD
jgi:hypothetical protein